MLIIPAIDILGGKCVRLLRGNFENSTVYSDDPVAVAKKWEREGAEMLHVVDLDGARTGSPGNMDLIRKILSAVSIPVEVGGGIRSLELARDYIKSGAQRVILGTRPLEDPQVAQELIGEFGSDRIVIAVELKGNLLTIKGWQKTLAGSLASFLDIIKLSGVTTILFTDVDRDGTLTEPNYGKPLELMLEKGFKVIASGGISDAQSISRLASIGVNAAILGTALYEKKITLREALAAANSNELTKRIIPCLDVTDGKVVKGVRFEDLKDAGDPVALGKKYSEEGADELVFLDITASKDNRQTLFNVVKDVAKNIFIPFTVGGGLQNIDDIRTALLLGADKVSLNTSAIKNPDLISEAAAAFGEQCVVVAMDVKKIGDKYKVFKKGGSVETELEAIAWAKEAVRRGAGEILLTSMDRDGTKLGYDLDITRAISEAVSVPVIASGGAGSLEDFKTVLTTGKADAALAASLFHYEESSVGKVKKYLSANNVPVRL